MAQEEQIFSLRNISRRLVEPTEQTFRDSVAEQQIQEYENAGLTYKTNNNNVNLRDSGGNIIVIDESESQTVLVIEPVVKNITMDSFLRVVNTQFNYFKFPARTIGEQFEAPNLDIDIDLATEDPIYARYKPIDQQQIPAGGNINFAAELEMSEIEEGALQKRPNRYYITKEIKNSGVDLRFRVKINFRYDSPDADFNTTYFYITRFMPDEKFTDVDYKEFFNFENPLAGGGRIDQYNVQEATKEVVIANSEFDVGDSFALFGLAGKGQPADQFKYSTINADQTYWSITDASKNVDEWNREIASPISQQTAVAQNVTTQNTIR